MNGFIDFLTQNFSTCIWLAVMILAMIPTLESKIAIPFAMNSAFFGNSALSAFQACTFAFLGSIIPSIIIILFARKIKSHTTGFISSYINSRYRVKTNIIEKQPSNFKKYLMLLTFVALPLPLTGVWAGSFIAGMTNLNMIKCFITISIGAFISCLIVTILCVYFENSIGYVLLISLALVALFVIVDILSNLIRRKKRSLSK